jgi:hypothetical protein
MYLHLSRLPGLKSPNVTSVEYVLGALEFKQNLLLRNLAARLMEKVRNNLEIVQ